MRIVTYNINGLRARLVPPRTLLSFLDSLEADIICLQETKITRQELTADIAVTEEYESFFSCTRTVSKGRVGYSGVATFCRTATAVPLAADEGFTGLLHVNRNGEIEGGKARVGCYEEVLNTEGMSRQELLQLDREGRCLITDHGSFVLFNLYGPSVFDNEERYDFKLRFYRALQNRWEGLLNQGRRVIAVGDFNISPYPVDSCNPGPDYDQSPIRQWFQSQLRDNGGPFLDVFRVIHPNREEAYTCWNQQSGAEEFNFGSRIDLVIAAGTCFHQAQSEDNTLKDEENHHFGVCEVEDCDILQQFKRFKVDSLPRRGGEKYEKLEGSDHAPVYVQLRTQPLLDQHDVPPLAARFMPELRGRQQSIVSLFQKRPVGSELTDIEACSTGKEAKLKLSPPVAAVVKKKNSKVIKKLDSQKGKQKSLRSFFMLPAAKGKENKEDVNVVKSVSQCSDSEIFARISVVQSQEELDSPQNEFSFLSEFDVGSIDASASQTSQFSNSELLPLSDSQAINEEPIDLSSISATNHDTYREPQKSDFETSQQTAAKSEWQRIQKAMMGRVPLCSGHNEPCVARIVKKPCPNLGRTFHCCARAQGPDSNPESRCNYFEWQNKNKKF